MGALTRTGYRTRVLLTLGNMSTADPLYTSGIVDTAINNAANRLIRMAIGSNSRGVDLFPEKHNTWTTGPTVVGENTIAVPSDCLAITEVHSADDSDDPGTWADTAERIVSRTHFLSIARLTKDSTAQAAYPRLWARKANAILYHPTTRTDYTTWLRIYGIAREEALSADGDTFFLHEDWDSAIVKLAAEEVARMRGWTERANELIKDVREQIAETVNVTTLGLGELVVESDMLPSRSEIHTGEN